MPTALTLTNSWTGFALTLEEGLRGQHSLLLLLCCPLIADIMSCNHPNKAFWTGLLTENGKRDYCVVVGCNGDMLNVNHVLKCGKRFSFDAPLKRVGSKIFLIEPIAIPCGACVGCRMERAKQWTIRLAHECQDYPDDQCHFITLTYKDSCLPTTKDGEPCLVKSDVQKFLNRLRNPTHGVTKQYRYLFCGEYGDLNRRPHYHAILFGPLDDLVPFAPGRFHSSVLEKAWPFGMSEASPVSPADIAYVAGYVEKKCKDDPDFTAPVKPFLMMSTRPMIGHSYISKLNGDRHVYGNFGSSRVAPVPRAYLKKHEQSDWYAAFKEESARLAKESLATMLGSAKTTDEEHLGNIKDAAAYFRLDEKRNTKL